MERPYLKAYPQGVRWDIEFPEVPFYQALFEQAEGTRSGRHLSLWVNG